MLEMVTGNAKTAVSRAARRAAAVDSLRDMREEESRRAIGVGVGIKIGTSRTASAPPFLATDVTGNLIWYRGDFKTLNGGDVSALLDQSGAGNNAVQATAGQQPLWIASDAAFNNNPVVSFTGATTDTLVSMATVTHGVFTLFMVVSALSAAGQIFYARVSGGSYREYAYGAAPASYVTRDGFDISSPNNSDGSGWGAVAGTKTICITFDGNNSGHAISVNGVDKTTAGSGTANPGTASQAGTIHLANDPNFAAPGTFKLGEFILYNSVLSAGDRTTVTNYLRTRYAHY